MWSRLPSPSAYRSPTLLSERERERERGDDGEERRGGDPGGDFARDPLRRARFRCGGEAGEDCRSEERRRNNQMQLPKLSGRRSRLGRRRPARGGANSHTRLFRLPLLQETGSSPSQDIPTSLDRLRILLDRVHRGAVTSAPSFGPEQERGSKARGDRVDVLRGEARRFRWGRHLGADQRLARNRPLPFGRQVEEDGGSSRSAARAGDPNGPASVPLPAPGFRPRRHLQPAPHPLTLVGSLSIVTTSNRTTIELKSRNRNSIEERRGDHKSWNTLPFI